MLTALGRGASTAGINPPPPNNLPEIEEPGMEAYHKAFKCESYEQVGLI